MYLFGPVPSRRLGLSLGVDLLNCKSCNLNCVYCELGKTFQYVKDRKIFVRTEDVLGEIRAFFANGGSADYVTFSGAGEPTLALNLGEAMEAAVKITNKKIALITNAVLFSDKKVREEAAIADVVLPSVDAVSEDVFIKLNRPDRSIGLQKYLDGLRQFSTEYSGKIWVEAMIVKGLNDSDEEVLKLKDYLDTLKNVERIQINTIVRARAEESAEPVDKEKLRHIKTLLGSKAEVIGSFTGGKIDTIDKPEAAVLSIIKLRPSTVEDIMSVLPAGEKEVLGYLENFVKKGIAEKLLLNGKEFYRGKA